MVDAFPDSPTRVEDPKVAALVTDPKAVSFLAPFMREANTVKGAHEALGVSSHTMLYWVNKFLDLGVLHVERVQERKGKPVKWYRTPGNGFLVPMHLIPDHTFEDLLLRHDEPFNRRLLRNLVQESIEAVRKVHRWEMVVWKEDTVRIDMRPIDGHEPHGFHELLLAPHMPAMLFELAELRLEFEDAKRLQRDLAALIAQYRGKQGGGRYLARVALAPLRSP